MLSRMFVPRALAALLALLLSGFWAGNSVAQAQSGGEWFDGNASGSEPAPGEPRRPLLRIHGERPLDPPPPDFRSDDAPASTARDAEVGEVEEQPDPEAQERALREFTPHLTPYGGWYDDPTYGRVWIPAERAVGVGFAPYVTGGHWELTVDGDWLWVSDYPFGWITFHYGRWVWLPTARWAWMPGYRYAPAWVDFRIGTTGYIGWGPLAPRWAWRHGVFVSVGVYRPAPFIFCPTAYVFAPSLHRHVIRDRHRVHAIAEHTHRYRPRGHRFGPSPAEARIPERALPARRTIARPRVIDTSGSVRSVTQFDPPRRSLSDRSRPSDVRSRRAMPAPSARAFGDPTWRSGDFADRNFADRNVTRRSFEPDRSRRGSSSRGTIESRRGVPRPPGFDARTVPRASSGREGSTIGSRRMMDDRRAVPRGRTMPQRRTATPIHRAPQPPRNVAPAPAPGRSGVLRPGVFKSPPPRQSDKRATDRAAPSRQSPAKPPARRSRDSRGGDR